MDLNKILKSLLLVSSLQFSPNTYAKSEGFNLKDQSYSFLEGAERHKIAYKKAIYKGSKKSIVFVHGTGESLARYYHIGEFFYNKGFNVYLYDQRGHGYSGRFDKNRTKIISDGYDRQIKDLSFMVNMAVEGLQDNKVYLVGHSMGSLIVLRYLELYPDTVEKATVVSPMLKMNTPIPEWATLYLSEAYCYFDACNEWAVGQHPKYVKNATHLDIKETHNGKLSSEYKSLIYSDPDNLRTWGVTYGWLREAIYTERATRSDKEIAKIASPILMLTASDDYFVDIPSEKEFCDKTNYCKQVIIQGSWHSILQESDEYRVKALEAILGFFE